MAGVNKIYILILQKFVNCIELDINLIELIRDRFQ